VYVRRCLGDFRLHGESKTCAKPENYIPDNKGLAEEYSKFLTAAQKKQLAVELKKKKARQSHLAAWEALKRKDVTAAREHAMTAIKSATLSPESWRALYGALRGR
jgi:hypothetical protein